VLATIESSDGRSRMNVELRVAYERLLALVRMQTTESRELILQFWTILAEKSPDLSKLSRVGLSIHGALLATAETFQELSKVAPQNAGVMRMHADFLLELANDPKKGLELLQVQTACRRRYRYSRGSCAARSSYLRCDRPSQP
jgi:hypothetical protein